MSYKVKYTGTVTASFSKTLHFHDEAEYNDFKEREEDNLLCNLETDDICEIQGFESMDREAPKEG